METKGRARTTTIVDQLHRGRVRAVRACASCSVMTHVSHPARHASWDAGCRVCGVSLVSEVCARPIQKECRASETIRLSLRITACYLSLDVFNGSDSLDTLCNTSSRPHAQTANSVDRHAAPRSGPPPSSSTDGPRFAVRSPINITAHGSDAGAALGRGACAAVPARRRRRPRQTGLGSR